MLKADRHVTAPGRQPTILQIVPRLDTGGAELTTIEMTEAIVRAGGRALVATAGGRMADQIARAGGELIIFPAGAKNPVLLLANVHRLVRLMAREGVDLLHARSRAPAWSALLAARIAHLPFVTTYHGAYAERSRAKRLYNSVMARGDRVIANSNYTAGIIKDRHGLGDARIRVIHRGVDVRAFDAAAISADRLAGLRRQWRIGETDRVILQAARLTGWKGQSVLIEAAGMLKRQGLLDDAVVVLAGDAQGRTGYVAALEQQIADLGLDDRVRLTGHCDDMPAAFALAHVAIVASIEPEAFGRVATEAQAMGCPVIATAIGAPPETIRAAPPAAAEQITGWLVPANDAGALAAGIAQAIRLPGAARGQLGERARAHAAAHFSLLAMQHATLAVYDEMLDCGLAAAFARAAGLNPLATG